MTAPHKPELFFDKELIPPMIFTPGNYGTWDPTPVKVDGIWTPGQWLPAGEIKRHSYKVQTLALHLNEEVATKETAALFAWYTSATQRLFVTFDYGKRSYTTRYLATQIEEDAKLPIVSAVVVHLFGVSSVREKHFSSDANDEFRIHIPYYQNPEKPYEQAPMASDQEWALNVAVAGAVAMLNEIDYGHILDEGSLR